MNDGIYIQFIWDDGGNQAGVLSVQDDNDVPKAETLRAFCASKLCTLYPSISITGAWIQWMSLMSKSRVTLHR